jgi:arylsulfatase A-like enzyme
MNHRQVLGALERAEVANETLVIWTADNGPTTSERQNGGTVGPFVGRWAQRVTDPSCTVCPTSYAFAPTPSEPRLCTTPIHSLVGIPCSADVGLGSTWEANLRMPAFARWPGKIMAGAVSFDMVSTLDIFATGMELAGVALPTDRTIDGISILPLLLAAGSESSGPPPRQM